MHMHMSGREKGNTPTKQMQYVHSSATMCMKSCSATFRKYTHRSLIYMVIFIVHYWKCSHCCPLVPSIEETKIPSPALCLKSRNYAVFKPITCTLMSHRINNSITKWALRNLPTGDKNVSTPFTYSLQGSDGSVWDSDSLGLWTLSII
jgi:hypothetical protein